MLLVLDLSTAWGAVSFLFLRNEYTEEVKVLVFVEYSVRLPTSEIRFAELCILCLVAVLHALNIISTPLILS